MAVGILGRIKGQKRKWRGNIARMKDGRWTLKTT